MQALGFLNAQRRLLPKALSYVPELHSSGREEVEQLTGTIKSIKARYGFIQSGNGTDYFFHLGIPGHRERGFHSKVNNDSKAS